MMSVGVAMRHTLRAHFCSNTILSIVVCLHSPQTKVCLLCARVILGTTIGIAVRCISRPLFLPNTTLGVAVYLHRPQTGVCLLRAEVPSWFQPLVSLSIAYQESSLRLTRLSALPSVFVALKPKSVRCVLGLVLLCLTRPSV